MCPIAFLCALIYALTCMALLSPLAVLTCITCVLACAGSGTHKCFCHAWLLESLSRAGLYSANRRHLYRGGRKTAGLASGYVVRVKVGGNFSGKRETSKNQYFLPPHLMIKDLTVYCKLYTSIFCQSSYKKKFPF